MRILNTDKQSIDAGRKERGKSRNCRAEEKENNNTNGKRENDKGNERGSRERKL